MMKILEDYSPDIEQYSIDEAWVDMSGTQRLFGAPRLAAEKMRQRIWEELGFTVNVGISTNKLLAADSMLPRRLLFQINVTLCHAICP